VRGDLPNVLAAGVGVGGEQAAQLGGLIVVGYADDGLEYTIGAIAIAFGAINIVGGFMVTDRMLGMFTRKPKPKADGDAKGGA